MGKKGFVKGLAAGAVLGAVAALVSQMQDKDKKASQLGKEAMRIKDKVAKHAMRLGKLSKSAYDKIVETTVAEFKGVKALSEEDMKDMRDELRAGWKDVENMMKPGKNGKKK